MYCEGILRKVVAAGGRFDFFPDSVHTLKIPRGLQRFWLGAKNTIGRHLIKFLKTPSASVLPLFTWFLLKAFAK